MFYAVVVAWHNPVQREAFLSAWGLNTVPSWVFLQQDEHKEGCAKTKNKGVRRAIDAGARVIVVLDDDCYPFEAETLQQHVEMHMKSLEPKEVKMFETVTSPPSRGTPYFTKTVRMPVAASMGYWVNVGDYDAPGQLVHGARTEMQFMREAIHGRYFPLSGMNIAFRSVWWPWCQFIDVPRFDDIWQGFIWQKEAYRSGHCFNLDGPTVLHSRQSDVWANLRDEAKHLEANETLWREIHHSDATSYEALRALLPI